VAAPDSSALLAEDDVRMWRTLVALLPYTIHVDHEAEWTELVRRDARQRAIALARIPPPRPPADRRRMGGTRR
jgi:hypothetical protein